MYPNVSQQAALAEGESVAGGAQGSDELAAVLGAAGLHHQDHLDLVHVQPRRQPLVT